MNKRVFIVHGWSGHPKEGWFPWLKKELEQQGFQVSVPQLPDSDTPRISSWVPTLASAVGTPDEQTYFVGHSMGCSTIVRYLETLPEGVKIGGAVFVAGFFKHLTLEGETESVPIAEPWLKTPVDFQKVRSHLDKSVAIFSDNDPYVPLDNQDDFRDKLGSEIIIEHGKWHFNEGNGVMELPSALESVLKISK